VWGRILFLATRKLVCPLCGWPGTKSSPTKRHFWGYVPVKSIVCFWV